MVDHSVTGVESSVGTSATGAGSVVDGVADLAAFMAVARLSHASAALRPPSISAGRPWRFFASKAAVRWV